MCDKKCDACGIDDQAKGSNLCPGCLDPPKVVISSEEMDRFLCVRTRMFGLIDRAIEQDGHHKSYEGTMSIHWPNRFEDSDGVLSIELACYVLGPSREYYWEGKTLTEALDKMIVDIDQWEDEINQFDPSESEW